MLMQSWIQNLWGSLVMKSLAARARYKFPSRSLSRSVRIRSSQKVELLEVRMLLSASAVTPASRSAKTSADDGLQIQTIDWHGQDKMVEAGSWIVGLDRSISSRMDISASLTSTLVAAKGDVPAVRLDRMLVGGKAMEIKTDPDASYSQIFAQVSGLVGFKYLEPNFVLSANDIPNDPSLPSLWGLNNTGQTRGTPDADIDAPEAWNIATGSRSVVVGVIDTGVDYNHQDLIDNMWTNPGEIAGNNVDDDSNGFVDDIHGWDFANDDSNPFDDHGHGTHCAGTIGGTGNNGVGVAGVNHEVSIMALKFLDQSGRGFTSDAVDAVNYATMMNQRGINIRVTSNSWGGGEYSQLLFDAIQASGNSGMLFIAAAGNSGTNNDAIPFYPASYNLDNVVSVAATDHNDALASFSQFGATSVDLAAPGVSILSTTPGNTYSYKSGTSMATPHVAGVAALGFSVAPNAKAADVKSALLTGVDLKSSLNGKVLSGGRLNAANTISILDDLVQPFPDIRVISSSSDGNTAFSLTYAIDRFAVTTPFDLGIYRSNDSAFGGDTLLSQVTISAAADLSVGTHTKTWTIGSGAGQIALPGAGVSEITQDYYLLAVADPNDRVIETDITSPGSNNVTVFSGVYHAPGGAVYVHGTSGVDSIDNIGSTIVTMNSRSYTYASGDVSALIVRGHDGDDSIGAVDFTLTAYGGAGNDVLIGSDGNDKLSGGSGNDELLGIDGSDTLLGGDGSDILYGGNGNDTLIGGSGNDELRGGTGDDVYQLSADVLLGSDTIDESGGGTDTLDFSSTTGVGLSVNLGLATAQVVCPNLTLTLGSATSIENIDSGSLADILIGNSLDNVLYGSAGDDVLVGESGNDILRGGDGGDRLIGGAGNDAKIGGTGNDFYEFSADLSLGSDTIDETGGGFDALDFSRTALVGITVNLGLTTQQIVCSNLTLTLGSATSIENINGGFQADTMTGNSLNNVLYGSGGNDVLDGGAGDDVLFGESGNDILRGGDANDTLIGGDGNDALIGGVGDDNYGFGADVPLGSDTIDESGSGIDTLDFSYTTGVGLSVNLGLATAQVVCPNLTLTLGSATTLENVVGSFQDDTLTGNNLDNVLFGGGGNDVLDGGAGRDMLFGESGNDTLRGGDGSDSLAGGSGDDALIGGTGNDLYEFSANLPLGSDTIVESDETGGGIDALDFSRTTLFPITVNTVNLGLTTPQVVCPNLTLTLRFANTIEIIYPSAGQGTLNGNSQYNVLYGGSRNDAPTVAGVSALMFAKGQKATAINTSVIVADGDNSTLASATVRISSNYVSGEDVLGFIGNASTGGIVGNFDVGTGTMTLTSATATVAQFQAALRLVTYRNASTSPSRPARSIDYQVNDGSLDSNVVTSLVTIKVPGSVTPIVTGASTLSYIEKQPARVINPSVSVSDSDSSHLASATVKISTNYARTQDVLDFVGDATTGNITGSFNAGTGTLTFISAGASATVAQFQAALRLVTYRNTSANPSTLNRSVTYQVSDGSILGNTAISTITIATVNDAPTVAGVSTLIFAKGQKATAINTSVIVADVDSSTMASARVHISSNYVSGEDVLGFIGNGSTGDIVGNFNSGTGTMTLTSATATVAQFQAALRLVTYWNTSSSPSRPARSIDYQVNDGSLDSHVVTSLVTIKVPGSATPIVTGVSTLSYIEKQPVRVINPSVSVSDSDSSHLAWATVKISANYSRTQDVLEFVGDATTGNITGSFNAGTGTLTLISAGASATAAQFQAALRRVTYRNTSFSPSTLDRSVSYQVSDGSNLSKIAVSTVTIR